MSAVIARGITSSNGVARTIAWAFTVLIVGCAVAYAFIGSLHN
jgi:hypothetical protein